MFLTMARFWLWLSLFIFAGFNPPMSNAIMAEPLIISPRRSASSSVNSHNKILSNGSPRMSAPPLPGGSNIIPEAGDDEEEDDDRPMVILRQGAVMGSVTYSRWTRRQIYQFQGVPYAKPPIGDLRFKPSEEAEPWIGILDASKFGRTCPVSLGPQSMPDEKYKEYTDNGNEEDCLLINIYSPSLSEESGLPVMVFFHGGGFSMRSPREFRPNLLLERDVVLVVPHYRLGPLGFLAAGVESAPGNAGLYDMVLALRWVRDNIVNFGGNPGRVTLFGQSAGAAAASLMLFSPLVDPGLFQRLILQSGSALSPWALDENPLPSTRILAQFANCTRHSIEREISCLKRLSYIDILKAHSKTLMKAMVNGEAIFGATTPVVQKVGSHRFLTSHPSELFIRGQFLRKPILGGVVAQEGSFIVGDIYQFIRTDPAKVSVDYMKHNFTRLIFKMGGLEDPTGFLGHLLTEKYFTPNVLGNFTLMANGLIDIASSALIKSSVFTLTQEMSRSRACFFYSFNYVGRYSKIGYGQPIDYPFSAGVAHADELLYLFPHKNMIMNDEEARISRQLVDLWTTFAIKGRPMASGAPRWNQITSEKGPYFRIESNFSERKNFCHEYRVTVDEGLPIGPFIQIE